MAAPGSTMAGRLDRRITIERATPAAATTGEPVLTWATLTTVWARKTENRGQERFAAGQRLATADCTFTVRWSATIAAVTVTDRIVWDGRAWDITAITEIGRREAREFGARAQVPRVVGS